MMNFWECTKIALAKNVKKVRILLMHPDFYS